MTVLIVRAGIAGLTLSALLRQKGIKPQIVDRASDFAQAGYMLGLFPMGNRVLHGLGARDSSRASSSRCKGRSRHRSLPPARGPTLVDETIGRLCRGADGRRAFSCSFGARASRPLLIMSGRDARAPEDHERRRSLPPAARFLPLFLVSGAPPAMRGFNFRRNGRRRNDRLSAP